ncbi:MAG: triose-phosphate isomerase [Gammaproteobacteria bacterium RIFCSPHIGHO2_12_FULL_40_19]|nr:MAG: triose-phosphate isomerase [Gammaproteobacteria bacterium RIFCSPHIGHO2_12_FULL_40_19]
MRRPLIAGNWKMHGTQKSAENLLGAIVVEAKSVSDVEFAVFPPFVHIAQCAALLSQTDISFGAQTVSEYADGAYTGEISASMLKDLGCCYVIIGHSERRKYLHESNLEIAKKCEMAFLAGLIPILCVGETLAEREQALTLSVVQEQLEVVCVLKDNCTAFTQVVVAYEPVWAIGTGKSATPAQAQAVHAAIRAQLYDCDPRLAAATRVLYGGSVKADNASALFEMPDIDGALVGGASLDAKSFVEIARSYPHG